MRRERLVSILAVGVGGTLGTAAREGVGLVVPDAGGFPLAILLVNLAGAFLLGLLLEALARRGPDAGRRRLLRLGAGTGFLGGFTTYSALAAGTATLAASGEIGFAVLNAVGTVVLGAAATIAGIAVGARTA